MRSAEFKPSRLVHSFEESATLALVARAKKLASEGRSIINFAAGEPDFNTPSEIINFAFEMAKKGQTKYTAVAGLPELRKTIAERISSDYGVKFSADEVLASCGGKQAIFHFLQAALEPDDEVLIVSPYWVSFPEMVKLVGAKPVIVRPQDDRLTAEDLKSAITNKTRLLILNSPSNPAGTVYRDDELQSFLEVIEKKSIWVLTDDTYYRLVYEPTRWTSVLKLRPDFRDRVCVIGSASKSYAMTGWRIGWAIAPTEMIAAMTKLQSQVTSSPAAPSQWALESALREFDSVAEDFRRKFKNRRDRMLEGVRKIPKLSVKDPDGAFYLFVRFANAMKSKSVTDFAKDLLEIDGVCTIPGVAFGEPDYLRLSYALSEGEIEEGLKRIRLALER